MALNTIDTTGLPDKAAASIGAALGELQRLKLSIGAGAGANTNIAIAGIALVDTLVAVIEVPANAALVDRTATTTITSAGNIQCSATTAGNQVLVLWRDKA